MKTIALKTNINCSACVANVTPTLNEKLGEKNWSVDTQNPKKILTVEAENLEEQDIIRAVEQAGYKAEVMEAM
ncbi:MAG: heavy-metal-associated domain-containing protein [Flavisolibacter sp.]